MNEKKIIKNIYRLLDGELNPREKDVFEIYLAEHPEAAKLFSQCEQVKQQFEALPKDEVDPEIKSGILNQINNLKQSQVVYQRNLNFVQDFWQRPVFRFSLVLLAGVFIGFFLFSILKTDMFQFKSDQDQLKGTLVNPRSFEEMKVADILQFNNQEVNAVCNARYSANSVEIHLQLSSDQLIKTVFEFNNDYFSVFNIQPVKVNNQSSTLVGYNSIVINNIGENNYIILLYNKKNYSQNIYFSIFQNELQLFRNAISINK